QLQCLLGVPGRAVEVTAGGQDLDVPEEQLTALAALALGPEQPRRAADPRLGDRMPALEAVVVEESGGDAYGVGMIARRLVPLVGALAGGDALVGLAEPPRRFGERVERLGIAARGRAGDRQLVVGALPVVPAECLAPVSSRLPVLGYHLPPFVT